MLFLFRWLMLPAMIAAAAFAAGWKVEARLTAGAAVQQVVRTVTVVQKQGAVNAAVAQAAQAHQDQARTVTKTLIERVPVYVTAQADAGCTVTRGLVRLLNDAAAGRDPGQLPAAPQGAGDPDDAPAGVELHSVAGSVTGNYGVCNAARAQLTDLQAWVRQQGLADR